MKLRLVVEFLAAAMISPGVGLAGSAPSGTVDPCALVSGEEAGEVMGGAVKKAAPFGSGRIAGCVLRHAGGRIRIISGIPGTEWVSEQIDRMQRGVRAGTYRENGGIGERAFFLKGREVEVLCLFEGPYYVQISVEGPHRAAALHALARRGATTSPR